MLLDDLVNSKTRKIGYKTKIKFKCDICGENYLRHNYIYRKMKKNKYYDKDYCFSCWMKKINSTKEFKKSLKNYWNSDEAKEVRKRASSRMKNKYVKYPELKESLSKTLKKRYEDKKLREKISKSVKLAHEKDSSIRKRISISLKKSGANIGDKNGMKKLEARKKVSEARKKMFLNPKIREEYSKKIKKAWEDGKFDGVRVGQCKWYEYEHSNGNIYKVQGTWELAFIKWLDDNGLEFRCHRGRIPYKLGDKNKNYYPDFWIYKWKSYADVKCRYFYSEEKFDAIKKSNPSVKVIILFKEDLIKLGVNL